LDAVAPSYPNYGNDPLDSDVEEEEYEEEVVTKKRQLDKEDELEFPSLIDESSNRNVSLGNDKDEFPEGISWRPNQSIPQPTNVSIGKETYLKPEHAQKFTTELSSFLAFVPIQFWKLHLERTNVYGCHHYGTLKSPAEEQGKVYGGRIWRDVALREFMTFLAYLLK